MAGRRSFRKLLGAAAGALLVLAASSTAHAQLHWDASAQVGVMKRVLTNPPPGGGTAGFGPVGQLAGHLALLPLVRFGGYIGHDISPMSDASARDLTWGGVRAKIMSPWPRGAWRAWLFVGFGYSGVYARSTSAPRLVPGLPGTPAVRADATVQGAGGGFFEVPFGLGASYKLWKPYELSAELGMHAGFGQSGTIYEDPGRQVTSPGHPDSTTLPAGQDRFAIGLTVGILIDL